MEKEADETGSAFPDEFLVAGRAFEDAKPSFGGRAVGVGAQRREGEG